MAAEQQFRSRVIFGPLHSQTPARRFSQREADLIGVCAYARNSTESREKELQAAGRGTAASLAAG